MDIRACIAFENYCNGKWACLHDVPVEDLIIVYLARKCEYSFLPSFGYGLLDSACYCNIIDRRMENVVEG